MRYNRIRAACAAICFALMLSSCSKVEDLPVEQGSTQKAPDTGLSSTTTEAPPTADKDTTTQQTDDTLNNGTDISTTTTTRPETSIIPETTTAFPVPEPEPAGSVPDDYREQGESGILIIGRNGHYTGLMGCWGTYELCDNYVEQVEKAAKALSGINVYSMVIPTSVEFYLPEDVTSFTASQKNKIEYIGENLTSVKGVDVWDTLAAHKEEPIYTRTDHHWQPLGAYYAAEVFAKAAGVDSLFPSLSEYKKVVREGYMGSLYNYSKSENLKSDPEPFTLYISPNVDAINTAYYDTAFQNGYASDLFIARDASYYYTSFLGSDNRIAEIETDCKNGKVLVICKESYGNALVPFLTSCYEKIYVTDLRYFDLNLVNFCRNVGATDLLFATCTYTPAGTNCKYLNYII